MRVSEHHDAFASRGICAADPHYLGSHFCFLILSLLRFSILPQDVIHPVGEAGLYAQWGCMSNKKIKKIVRAGLSPAQDHALKASDPHQIMLSRVSALPKAATHTVRAGLRHAPDHALKVSDTHQIHTSGQPPLTRGYRRCPRVARRIP